MSKVLTINGSGFANFSKSSQRSKKAASMSGSVLSFQKATRDNSPCSKSIDLRESLKKSSLILISSLIFSGIIYLYQVNDLANKGYEMKEIEHRIATLKEFNEKNKIKETELRSMYNIEKITQNLNLVSSDNISYLELNGPMAMK